jgi:hypothetical protein
MATSPSIEKVNFEAEQNFFGKTIDKITVPFEHEEDMILLCLSIFLHDFVHDYNLVNMHKRVIKSNAYDLLQNFNIVIKNATFKIFTYEISTGAREVILYKDSVFQDFEQDPGTKPVSYAEYFHETALEKPLMPTQRAGRFADSIENDNPFQIKDFREQSDDLEQINIPSATEFQFKPDITNPGLKSNIEDASDETIASGKSITSDILNYPLNGAFLSTEIYNSLITSFSNNADFLGFYSGLKTFIGTYVGSNIGGESQEFLEIFNIVKPDINSIETKNLIMYNYILCSIDCIAADFKQASLNPTNYAIMYDSFSEILSILRVAFVTIFSKTNQEFKLDPLQILNSSNVLHQFIIYYMLFLNCENSEEFNTILQSQTGGAIEDEDGKPKNAYTVLEELDTNREVRQYGDLIDVFKRQKQKKEYNGTEAIFITHNNLLTTLARGMFVKLGIWNKIFSGLDGYSYEPASENYIYRFGIKELNIIGYDILKRIFPFDTNLNNELLIMQILILKDLLIEMSPSKTLTFGSGIDDKLKNYLDSFYNSHFVNQQQKVNNPPLKPEIDKNVIDNPNIDLQDPQDEIIFDSDSEQHDSDEGEMFGGGLCMSKPCPTSQTLTQPDSREVRHEGTSPGDDSEQGIQTTEPEIKNWSEIIKPGRAPGMPILLKNLKKMYQNNIYTIQNLQASRIPPIDIPFGSDTITVYTLYELLTYNQTIMHRTGSSFNIPAPAFKFVINNAANISANINGSKYFYNKTDRDNITNIVNEVKDRIIFYDDGKLDTSLLEDKLQTVNSEYATINERIMLLKDEEKQLNSLKKINKISIDEYNRLLEIQVEIKKIRNTELIPCENRIWLINEVINNKSDPNWLNNWNYTLWLEQCQPLFGLYRNLARGTFCPTVSMMDAMDNCSLKHGATEPKEVGTMNFELKYESGKPGSGENREISFGGVVLNYNAGEQLNAKIDFNLKCVDEKHGVNDVANISTVGIKVSESRDLQASVVYERIVSRISDIYNKTYGILPEADLPTPAYSPEEVSKFLTDKINRMWSNMQFYNNPDIFNTLLDATAIKTFGDFLQECLACMQWGGYVNSTDNFSDSVKEFIRENNIDPIYRSVSNKDSIIPYDMLGNALRFGVQGDRPSGFRSIYILLNGLSGINQQAIAGYLFTSPNQSPSRSLIVSRNSIDDSNNNINKKELGGNGLRGKVIYTTRELQVIQEDRIPYLESLQYKKITETKTLKDKVTGEIFTPDITGPTIEGTYSDETRPIEAPIKIPEFKNSNYQLWSDYETPRIITETNASDDLKEEKARKADEKRKELEREKAAAALLRKAEKESTAESGAIKAEEKALKALAAAEAKAIAKAAAAEARVAAAAAKNPEKAAQKAAKEKEERDNDISLMAELDAKPYRTGLEERRLSALKAKYEPAGGSRRNKLIKRRKTTKRNKRNKQNKKTRSQKKKINTSPLILILN